MECDNSEASDVFFNKAGSAPHSVQLGRARPVRVDGGAGLPGAPPAARVPPRGARPDSSDDPFMSEMDEITYWIHTKRAPCLLNYDNPIKKRNKAQSSKEPRGEVEETRSPKKKKKRKLSLLDDSVSSEGQHNVYFESQNKTRQSQNKCKVDSLCSDVDFNIKETSVQRKCKGAKLQKNNQTIHKKTKVITSTPKPAVNLRRSLRHNKGVSHHFNNSFDVFHASINNGAHINNVIAEKPLDQLNQSVLLGAGDQTVDKKNCMRNRSRAQAHNGHYDDVSDVSGFTANYIRSTKVQANKTQRNMRCKSGRNLVKELQKTPNDSNMVVSMNKSVNTGPNNVLNCSTDSSLNLINLVTSKSKDKLEKVDKSTSLLKFMNTKTKVKEKTDGKRATTHLNVSFQSQSSSASRYPKRVKTPATSKRGAQSSDRATNKNGMEFNNSDKKENPGDTLISKTRSGRNIGLSLMQRENSVLVVSNSTEQVSSKASLNVASPKHAQSSKKKRMPARQVRVRKSDKVQSPRRDSLRDRSGFAACFSESDDDSEPLVQRKYFCP